MRTFLPLLALGGLLVACPADDDDRPDDDDLTADDDDVTGDDDDATDPADDDDATPPPEWSWDPADFDSVYDVGPGQAYAEPGDVPWESLSPSSLVRIHHRAEPYAAKWVIHVDATEDDPVVVTGVPSSGGELPVITGDGATTRLELDYWNEDRSVIKIGGASIPGAEVARWITVAWLEVRSAHPDYGYTDDGGSPGTYNDNAAAIHVEQGEHVTVVGCELHDSGNGLFTSGLSSDVALIGNHLHGNGNVGSQFEHNSYSEARGILYEFNRYGPLRDGADGNNLKDRSSGVVVRYNWIESGNRQLDLVESGTDGILNDPAYRDTFVYGNVLIEPDGAGNSQILHYGGDGSDAADYRKGTLHFFGNTVVSTRSGTTTLVRLSTAEETADIRNNVVHATAGSGLLAISAGDGVAELRTNHLTEGWTDCHCELSGSVTDEGGNQASADPGFADLGAQDFVPADGSPLLDAAGPPDPAAGDHPQLDQYVVHQQGEPRPVSGPADVGAFERP